MHKRMPSPGSVSAVSLAVLAYAFLIACPPATRAQAPAVPPAASPGGALPALPGETLPAPPEAGAFPVPPAVERPLGVEEGERVFVKEFRIEGVKDRPGKGIVEDEIQRLVEELRVKREGLEQVGDDGFTPAERDQIKDFMRQVVDNPDLDMKFDEYQALVDKLRQERQQRRAGLTVGQMQEIANAVTEYYRSAGFILAQAFIPAQEVVDGVVQIQVVEGRLGNVLAEGNERYSDETLAAPFEDLIDAPVTAGGTESAILTLTDYPGLSAFGVFRPGEEVGTSDLLLQVQDEDPWDASVRFDNHGTRFTGRNRLLGEFAWNNPTGGGDRLSGSALRTFRPRNSVFMSVDYEHPLFSPSTRGSIGASRNLFDVGDQFKDIGITGETEEAHAKIRQTLIRGRQANAYASLQLTRKNNFTKQNGTLLAEDNLSYLEGRVSLDNIDPEAKAINQGSIGVFYGLGGFLGGMTGPNDSLIPPSRQGKSGEFADNHWWKLEANYARLQKLNWANQSVLVRVEGQLSSSLLVSTEQYSIGGPANMRGYPIAEFLADSAIYGSLEWIVNAPFFAAEPSPFKNLSWGEVLRVSFFTDFASGDINDRLDEERPIGALGDFGLGVQLSVPGQFTARLQAARPFAFSTGLGDPRDDPTQYWFDLTYSF